MAGPQGACLNLGAVLCHLASQESMVGQETTVYLGLVLQLIPNRYKDTKVVLALNQGAWSSLTGIRGFHSGQCDCLYLMSSPPEAQIRSFPGTQPHPSSLAHGLLYSTGQPQK